MSRLPGQRGVPDHGESEQALVNIWNGTTHSLTSTTTHGAMTSPPYLLLTWQTPPPMAHRQNNSMIVSGFIQIKVTNKNNGLFFLFFFQLSSHSRSLFLHKVSPATGGVDIQQEPLWTPTPPHPHRDGSSPGGWRWRVEVGVGVEVNQSCV